MIRKIVIGTLLAGLLIGIYSYKLLQVPTGLTLDEASFGYNAVLLEKTGRDENHRFLPLFVLAGGTDWRQPVTQYYLTGLFKIFGASVYLLRFSSVLLIVGSILAIYFLFSDLIGRFGAIAAAGVMTVTPAIMIQAHMALDNIMPIPFTIVWLWSVNKFLKEKRFLWIGLMGFTLGASMYSYKGMRPVALIWLILSTLIVIEKTKSIKEAVRRWIWLGISAAPFFLIIPLIEKHYPGAMMGGAALVFDNAYNFFLPYLSSFDVSNLFITGDLLRIHSTQIYGMYLLSTAPWFFVGAYQAIRRKEKFLIYVLAAFLSGPLLFGLVGSVHRFSRLMMLAPLYSLISGMAIKWTWSGKKRSWRLFAVAGILLIAINFADFLNYYWNTYPGLTEPIVGTMKYYKDFATLAVYAKKTGDEPILQSQVDTASGISGDFFQEIYFGRLLRVVKDDDPLQRGEIILTTRHEIPGARRLPGTVQYNILAADK